MAQGVVLLLPIFQPLDGIVLILSAHVAKFLFRQNDVLLIESQPGADSEQQGNSRSTDTPIDTWISRF